jgi:hypothetical protein
VTGKQELYMVRLAVGYDDGFVKCQAWPLDLINQTERLVFSPDQMEPKDRRKFLKANRDWRDNPCLVRYRRNGKTDFICNRGEDGQKRKNSTARGRALGLEFRLIDENGLSNYYHFDTDWINDTKELTFQRSTVPYGGLTELKITRIDAANISSTVDIPLESIHGRMAWHIAGEDAAPCGLPEFARTVWH